MELETYEKMRALVLLMLLATLMCLLPTAAAAEGVVVFFLDARFYQEDKLKDDLENNTVYLLNGKVGNTVRITKDAIYHEEILYNPNGGIVNTESKLVINRNGAKLDVYLPEENDADFRIILDGDLTAGYNLFLKDSSYTERSAMYPNHYAAPCILLTQDNRAYLYISGNVTVEGNYQSYELHGQENNHGKTYNGAAL